MIAFFKKRQTNLIIKLQDNKLYIINIINSSNKNTIQIL